MLKSERILPLLALAAGFSLATVPSANAGAPSPTSGKAPATEAVAPKEESIYDKIWSKTVLYKDKNNPSIQEIALSGRAQFDYFNVSSDQGDDDDWEVRRLRSGIKVKFLKNWLLHAEADFNANDPNPFYNKITEGRIQYTVSDALVFNIGKHGVKFTLDGATSSKELIAVDRSNLANNLWFTEEYAPGVSVSGESGPWHYFLGWFTSDGNPEFGEFDAGTFVLGSVGYDFAKSLGADEALLRLDYVYQQPDEGNSATRPFEHIGSVNFNYKSGPWGMGADFSAGNGYGKQGDIFGLQVMPTYDITDKLQLVARYTYMNGDDNSIRLARYENRVVSGRGDEYNEFYAGLNYYFYEHKLKWQTGVQYAMMNDSKNDGGEYDGWQVISGIRISW